MNILYVFYKNIKTFYIIKNSHKIKALNFFPYNFYFLNTIFKNTLNMAYFKLFYGIFCEIQTKG